MEDKIKQIKGWLEEHGCVEGIPLESGFHTTPTLLSGEEEVEHLTVKTQRFKTEQEAKILAALVNEYREQLKGIGMNTPRLFRTFICQENQEFLMVEVASYEGNSIATSFDQLGAKRVAELIITDLLKLFRKTCGQFLQVGLDPSCRNYTYRDGQIYYVDFIPPRFCLNSEPLVDYPPPIKETDLKSQSRRFYSPKGVLLIALTQILRHEPESLKDVLQIMETLCEAGGYGNIVNEINQMFVQPQDINRSNTEELRLLALVKYNFFRLDRDLLRSVYRLTHIDEKTRLIPNENYEEVIKILA